MLVFIYSPALAYYDGHKLQEDWLKYQKSENGFITLSDVDTVPWFHTCEVFDTQFEQVPSSQTIVNSQNKKQVIARVIGKHIPDGYDVFFFPDRLNNN